jgi:hypothetical protein
MTQGTSPCAHRIVEDLNSDTFRAIMKDQDRAHQSKNFKFVGYRIPKKTFLKFVMVGVCLIALTITLASILYLTDSDEQMADSLPYQTPDNLPVAIAPTEAIAGTALELILAHHRKATGLQRIIGMILHGSYIEGDTHYELDLSIRSPELIRKKIRSKNLEITCCSDGGSGSVKIHPTNGQATIREMGDDLYRYTLLLEGATMRLTGSFQSEDWKYALIFTDEQAGGNCIISSNGPSGIILTHLINKETGYELERSVEVRINEKLHKLTLFLSDYREVGNAYLPHHYALSVNGTVRAETTIESIQVNPGLQPGMFSLN